MAKVYVQEVSEKDQPNGYAGLDGTGKVTSSSLPIPIIVTTSGESDPSPGAHPEGTIWIKSP